jgi:hypothetical protein
VSEQDPKHGTDEKPPFLGTWDNVYTFVVCYLACLIAGLYLFSHAFVP